MKKAILFTLGFIVLQLNAIGQLISLSHDGGGPLWIDADKVYNYNQYEKSRWGLGFQWGWQANEIDTTHYGWDRLSAGAYVGYGYADQRFKWGANVSLWGNPKLDEHFHLSFFHDLTPDASRTLPSPGITILTLPASFMTRLYSDTWRLSASYTRRMGKRTFENIELRLSRERALHDNVNLYYPASYSDLKDLYHYDFLEGKFSVHHTSGWSAEMTFGTFRFYDGFDSLFSYSNLESGNVFLRLLVQYERTHRFSFLELQLFGQGGIVKGPNGVPYSRRFDLGGSWGSPLILTHSLLTARQNEFTASTFALVAMKLTTQNPLFEYYNPFVALGTAPHPFVLCNGAWGNPAPEKGIGEVGAGIDGLLVWGLVDWGLGVVYRLTPTSAVYHLTEPKNNFALFFTATLEL